MTVLVFLFLTLIALALRSSTNRSRDARRAEALVRRVGELEDTMESFRADMEAAVAEFRALTREVRGDVGRLKKSGDRGGNEGGGSPPSGGAGGPGSRGGEFGFGAATDSDAAADFDAAAGVESSALAPFDVESAEELVPSTIEIVQPKGSAVARGLQKSRTSLLGKLKGLFSSRPKVDESSLEDLEELLITSDVGTKCASQLVGRVREQVIGSTGLDEEALKALLKREILSSLVSVDTSHRIYTADESPLVVLVVGVNGVGKTTTVAKLASRWTSSGKKVVMVAADTFRAAAVQQLQEWGRRLDVPVISGPPGCKPQTVIFDGMVQAKETAADVIIIDTAGRLHTKTNLMQELEGVRNAVSKHFPGAPHETVLVLDGVSGQNALMQAREFHQATPLTGIVITKLDGTPKGGIVIAVSQDLRLPVFFIGVGERADDLVPFSPQEFVSALLGDDDTPGQRGSSGDSGGNNGGSEIHLASREIDFSDREPGLGVH
jgi:fused signal recognition particle receptor